MQQELNTIIAALQLYHDHNQGDPHYRSDAIHALATNGEQDVSLDQDGIAALLSKVKTLDAENPMRLLHVLYDQDEGLVSLETGELLMSTWDTQRVSSSSKLPTIILPAGWAYEYFGDEHTWGDVIGYLQQQYDWKNKLCEFPESNINP